MKFNDIVFLGMILVLVIIIFTTCSCVSFMPYDEKTVFLKQYQYEGMTNEKTDDINGVSDTKTIKQKKEPIVKKEGFGGIQGSPYNKETPIDKFDPYGKTQGSVDCIGNSSTLSNSKGGLCLSDEQIFLLKSRGGNATGGDFQFGK